MDRVLVLRESNKKHYVQTRVHEGYLRYIAASALHLLESPTGSSSSTSVGPSTKRRERKL